MSAAGWAWRVLALCLAIGQLGACAGRMAPLRPEAAATLARSRQLLLVTATDWNATSGTLRRFERSAPDAPWRPVGNPTFVNLGRHGLGWGLGLHGASLGPGPVKREGDGRAPAGLFALGTGFAGDPAVVGPLRIPVLTADARLVCVDDGASRFYNRIVSRTEATPRDWTSAEDMLRPDGQYRYGVFVRHNVEPALPGRGSCIFLHVWLGRGVASSGCTNMNAPDMLALMRWLDASATPLLAQLPQAEYARLRTSWRLP